MVVIKDKPGKRKPSRRSTNTFPRFLFFGFGQGNRFLV